jgi:hypothetical protein
VVSNRWGCWTGLKDRSNGQACGSEGRWRSGSTLSFDEGWQIPGSGEERCKGGGETVVD